MFEPEMIVEMTVQKGAVHIQEHGIDVIPAQFHRLPCFRRWSGNDNGESSRLSPLSFRMSRRLLLGFLGLPGCRGVYLVGGGQVVQVMGNIVAILATRELGHHACRVRGAMAILAFGDHLVL